MVQVSTHSRLKAAVVNIFCVVPIHDVSTHSRLKAADTNAAVSKAATGVSTHSRLKAAGLTLYQIRWSDKFQHTAA